MPIQQMVLLEVKGLRRESERTPTMRQGILRDRNGVLLWEQTEVKIVNIFRKWYPSKGTFGVP